MLGTFDLLGYKILTVKLYIIFPMKKSKKVLTKFLNVTLQITSWTRIAKLFQNSCSSVDHSSH